MPIPLFDRNPTTRFPLMTIVLIAVNLGVAWWSLGLAPQASLDIVFEYGLVPARLSQIDSGQPVDIRVEIGEARYQARLSTDRTAVYRSLLTMMFLHGGWLHVVTNMWMLWVFGNNVEDRLGHFIFVAFYVLGGVLASYCQWIIDPASQTPVIGASGAVWGVLGGYAVTFPRAKVLTLIFIGVPFLVNLPAALVIAVAFAADLVVGVMMLQGAVAEPIAHWAHVGGCVAGVVLMPLLGLGAAPAGVDWQSEAAEGFRPNSAGGPPTTPGEPIRL